jgi:hypothetical protein
MGDEAGEKLARVSGGWKVGREAVPLGQRAKRLEANRPARLRVGRGAGSEHQGLSDS